MKLGDICSKIGSGATPRGGKDSYKDSGTAIIRSQNVLDWTFSSGGLAFIDDDQSKALSNVEVKQDDVLLNITGDSVARACMVPSEFLPARVNQHVAIIRANEKANGLFLLAWLQANKGTLLKLASSGATRNALTKRMLENLDVNLPPIDVQNKVAAFIDSIQAKITLNTKLNGYLEELCDALFLDFLEQADSSWHEGTLEELAEVKYGKDHKKLADGPYPVYGSGGFMRSAEKSLFSGESVLIPRKGSLNNVMYVNEAFWTVDTMFFTVPRIPGAAKFLYQYVKRLDLASMNSGSAVPSMTTSILNALSLPVPPRDSLLSFNAKLQSMYDAVRANNLENRGLKSLRDSLLPKLMTGEIDVSKIDLTQLNSHLTHNRIQDTAKTKARWQLSAGLPWRENNPLETTWRLTIVTYRPPSTAASCSKAPRSWQQQSSQPRPTPRKSQNRSRTLRFPCF